MATFAAGGGYSEQRPAYTDEAAHAITVTLAGSGSIAGQTFAAAMYAPDGTAADGTPIAAVVGDGTARQVLVTLPGQGTAGEYGWDLRRTDDDSDLVVAHGRIDITLSGGRS